MQEFYGCYELFYDKAKLQLLFSKHTLFHEVSQVFSDLAPRIFFFWNKKEFLESNKLFGIKRKQFGIKLSKFGTKIWNFCNSNGILKATAMTIMLV